MKKQVIQGNPSIIEKINVACEDRFQTVWQREYEYLMQTFAEYSVAYEASKNMSGRSYIVTPLEEFWKSKVGAYTWELNNFQRQSYSSLWRIMTDATDFGIADTLAEYKAEWLNDLTSKLHQAISKHVVGYDDIENITVENTEKGYTIESHLVKDGQRFAFRTDCIEAGGYNIQCQHNRYIVYVEGKRNKK